MVKSANHNKSSSILIVDDDAAQRGLLANLLGRQGYDIEQAGSGEKALEQLELRGFDMMISDVRMPGMTGLETLREAQKIHPSLPVLLVTAYADVQDAVGAIQDGAVNYLEKPIDFEDLLRSVRKALGATAPTHAAPLDRPVAPSNIVAESEAMRSVLRETALVADSDCRILITGESGVGKEVVADLAHEWSSRASGVLIKVNCAAIPDTLLESELFGHEKGAFTGADSKRVGRFEEAHGGTIFLDEIAEMSAPLQARLLRVLQDGVFQRIGSNKDIQTDARVLAATNRNLEREVEEDRFREDLFYRLNVVEIYVPPLCERQSDILPLAERFLEDFSRERRRLSAGVATALQLYDWPGNVRELRNAMERAALMARSEVVLPEHLPKRVRQASESAGLDSNQEGRSKRMEDVERALILSTLRELDYNRSETARRLGISRRALQYKLRRYAEEGCRIDPARE